MKSAIEAIFGLLLFFGFLGLAFFVLYKACMAQPLPQPERIYSTRYGTVLCGSMERTSCGVRLWNCHDGRVYECLTDVRYGDE